MIVNLEGLPGVVYLAYDRVNTARPIRHYYQVEGYPALVLVTQGTEFKSAMLEAMLEEHGSLVARIEGSVTNNPERWWEFLNRLAGEDLGLPPIHVKLTLFRPQEPKPSKPVPIGPWLYEMYRAAMNEAADPKQLQALRAQVRALKED